jgi:predicted membrane protein
MMWIRLTRIAILAAMIVGGLLLAVTVAYFLRGSLEEFPTAERQETVHVVTAVIAGGLCALEVALLLALRWVGRATAERRAATEPGR